MHEIVDRSVHLDARNREARTEVKSFMHQNARYEGIANYVPWLNHSCIKMHATGKSVNYVPRLNNSCNKLHATRESWITYRGWFIHATRCTLRGNRELRTAIKSFVQQVARYEGIVNHVSGLNRSCNKLHATGKSWITYRGWFIRAS